MKYLPWLCELVRGRRRQPLPSRYMGDREVLPNEMSRGQVRGERGVVEGKENGAFITQLDVGRIRGWGFSSMDSGLLRLSFGRLTVWLTRHDMVLHFESD